MINKLQEETDEAKAVKGLIFDTESVMTSENTYSIPPIMSEATPAKCAEMKPYCYNELEDPSLYSYTVDYKHVFIENCWVLDPLVPMYYTYTGIWLAMALGFSIYLYFIIPAESRLSLQKSLLLLPALKACEVILEGIWLDYCPWVGMSNSAYQYI